MIDIHVHFGKFRGIETNIPEIIENLTQQGITQIGLMPLLDENASNLKDSHSILKKYYTQYETQIIPILWVPPHILMSEIETLMSEIPYKIIKIHGYLHHWTKENIIRIIKFTEIQKLPIMFHTGGCKHSEAGFYMRICQTYPNQKFILAHGRPIKQSIKIMQLCNNVLTDTAFMSIDDLQQLVDKGLQDRVLFGTDYPINKYFYPDKNPIDWYKEQIDEIVTTFGIRMRIKG